MATTTVSSSENDATSTYPDLASPTDSVIAGDFGAMSLEEQEAQREEWKAELTRTEDEISTLKQVLVSKEAHAAGLKRRLGITAWREFSEDMTQGLKNLQESAAYKKTAVGLGMAKEKTAGIWSSVTSSNSFQSVSGRMGSAFGAAKGKISQSMSTQNIAEAQIAEPAGSNSSSPTAEKPSNGATSTEEKK